MKQLSLLFFLLTANYLTATCQLDKGVWLVGGSGKLYTYNSTFTNPNYRTTVKYTQIDLSPNIGYFIADKLAAGLKPNFSFFKGSILNQATVSGTTKFFIGPFLRYYFLSPDNPFNILTDISYQVGINQYSTPPKDKGKISNFSLMAGPEIFFNSSVGIELLIGYTKYHESVESSTIGYSDNRKGLQVSIGLQIHLEKN